MPDPYEGVTKADPERFRLSRSWFRPSPLAEVAEGISVASQASQAIHPFYVERIGCLWRWRLGHLGGGYPLLRITARFLQVDYCRIYIACKAVEGHTVLMVPDDPTVPDAFAVVTFAGPTTPEEVATKILKVVGAPGTKGRQGGSAR